MKKAFTLVELLVTIGLITILTSVVLARFNDYSKKQKAVNAAERIRQVIIEAKTNNLAKKINENVCGNNKLEFWEVAFSQNPAGYTIQGYCNNVSGTLTPFFTRQETFTGVTMNAVNRIRFVNGTFDDAQRLIILSSGGNTKTITVGKYGLVTIP